MNFQLKQENAYQARKRSATNDIPTIFVQKW